MATQEDESHMVDSPDDQPLVAGHENINGDLLKPSIKKPSRLIIIEPLLLGYALFNMPSATVSQQYLVDRIKEELDGNFSGLGNVSACSVDKSDPAYISMEDSQSRASYLILYMDIISTIPAMVLSMFLGAYSDKAGRRYAILPPLFGACASALTYVCVINFKLPLECLFIGSFLSGCSGSFGTFLMGALSYIADITTNERKAFRITVAEMCMMASIIFSLIGTGIWVKVMGYLWPFVFVLGGNCLLIFYATFFVPETIIADPDIHFFTLSHIKKTAVLFTKDNGSNRRWKLQILLAAVFFPMLAVIGNGIDTLFMKNAPLCWDSVYIALAQGLDYSVILIGAGLGARFFKRCMSDVQIVLFAGAFGIAKFTYKAFVKNTAMMFTVSIFSGFSFLVVPILRAIMANMVLPHEHGAVFSGIAVVETASMLVGHAIFNPIYAATTRFMSGFVYLPIATCYVLGTVLVGIYAFRCKKEMRKSTTHSINEEVLS